MNYTYLSGSDLELLYLSFMICFWLLWEIPMNWFVCGEFMEKRTVFLCSLKVSWLKFLENFSAKGLKDQLLYQYVGSRKVGGTWWRKLLMVWIFGWLMGSLWIFWYMNSQAIEKRRETLANMCDERARMLQDQFNVSMNHVQALAILASTFHHGRNPSAIDQATFAKYTERTAFERPLTSGVAYAVRVLHSEREQFERQQGWTIKKMYEQEQNPVRKEDNTVENHEPSPIQPEYAPVIFAQDTVSHIVSFDMLTGKEDRENIIRARASGKGVLTAPFRLLKSNRLGVILTFAVYKKELPPNVKTSERIQATDGYIGGIFDIESLVEKLLHQLASKQTIIVNVYDTTNKSEPISMYGSGKRDDAIYHISSLHFGDPFRRHEMHCRFKKDQPVPWLAITTSIGVLIIALLVGHIFHATMNRIAKVEDDYRDMMELKKRAEAADIAKSQFLATVSHEIRTPMNGVLGMLQMLMDTDLDVTQQDYVRTAQASGKALVSLINEVLDQAKIESGKLELEAVRFDLRSIMDDVISLFSGKSHDKGIELGLYISDQVPEILIGDPGRFRQIVTNLVGNSIKFTEKGHIFVSVHLVEEVMNTVEIDSSPTNTLSGLPVVDKHRSFEKLRAFSSEQSTSRKSATPQSSELIHLVVSVEDTGVGIPQEAQSRMFTPFMQVGPSISRIHGGTGIGLSISKCLVDLMKGEIGFASEVQIGSTFSFTAIFTNGSSKLNESKNLHHQETNEKQNDSVTLEFQGMTALVIDPRATRANVTKYHLHRLGIDVKLAKDVDQTFSIVNNSESVINMVLFEQEVWSGFPDVSLLVEKVKRNGQLGLPKIFVLVNSTGSAKIHPTVTTGYPPIVILKPLRACMLAATLRRVTEDGKKRIFHEGGLLHLSSLKKLLHGRHILVVDDNQVNLIVAAGALKKYGAQVTRAKSAKEAIDLLKLPHDFDACFMDIQMPEMDGFQATRRIRQMEKDFNSRITSGELSPEIYRNIERWHLPILAMTADVIQATQEECSKCGMDGYVSKPFEGEHLYREVVRFFSPAASQNQ